MSEVDLKRFFLEQVRLFETFPADKVEEIVIKSRLATYEGNEAILETGDDGRFHRRRDQRPRRNFDV
jgi:acetate kinase